MNKLAGTILRLQEDNAAKTKNIRTNPTEKPAELIFFFSRLGLASLSHRQRALGIRALLRKVFRGLS